MKKDLKISMSSNVHGYIFPKRISEVGSSMLLLLEIQLFCHVALLCEASTLKVVNSGSMMTAGAEPIIPAFK